tara:strand:+ start:31 stop:777 length:747 start_codon:yes stop_codon:yes gene_type:complete
MLKGISLVIIFALAAILIWNGMEGGTSIRQTPPRLEEADNTTTEVSSSDNSGLQPQTNNRPEAMTLVQADNEAQEHSLVDDAGENENGNRRTDKLAIRYSSGNTHSSVNADLLNANPKSDTLTSAQLSNASQSKLLDYGFKRHVDVYPQIDVVEYVDAGRLDTDFQIQPGGDYTDIQINIPNATIQQSVEGDLQITLQNGESLTMSKPRVWQESDGKREILTSNFVVNGSTVSYEVEQYDNSKPLIID